jgi:hypothetical protein
VLKSGLKSKGKGKFVCNKLHSQADLLVKICRKLQNDEYSLPLLFFHLTCSSFNHFIVVKELQEKCSGEKINYFGYF